MIRHNFRRDSAFIGRAILAPLAHWAVPKSGWHLAAFLARLPSMEAEIDDKLPSNSR